MLYRFNVQCQARPYTQISYLFELSGNREEEEDEEEEEENEVEEKDDIGE